MPWHIPLINEAPDLCVWDAKRDVCPGNASKSFSVNNLLMFFKEFDSSTWKQNSFIDVDGNTWDNNGSVITAKDSENNTWLRVTRIDGYGAKFNVLYFGNNQDSTLYQNRSTSLYKAQNGGLYHNSFWFWVSNSQEPYDPSQTSIAQFWLNVSENMNTSSLASVMIWDFTGYTPFVFVDALNKTLDEKEFADYGLAFATGASGDISVTLDTFREHCPSMYWEEEYLEQRDPYEPEGYSGSDIPGGSFDKDDDTIPLEPLPTLNTADTGFVRIYNPTRSELRDLANYLWTDSSIWQTIKDAAIKYFDNPMDAFICLNFLPISIPTSGIEEFKVCFIPTGRMLSVAAKQFVELDCGSCFVDRSWGSALDYSPYTKIHVYLPYIGSVQLDTDDVMNKTLHLLYRVDIVSGACTAILEVEGRPKYQYSGHCAINIPLSSANFNSYLGAIIEATKAAASIAAGAAGASSIAEALAGVHAPSQRTGSKTVTYTGRNPKTGRQIKLGSETTEFASTTSHASFESLATRNIANTVGAVMGSKPEIQRSGGYSGNSGFIGSKTPYITKVVPRLANPEGYGKYNGRPSLQTLSLGSCHGFTQVQQVWLTGLGATNPEVDEILSFLKSGVIL